MSNKIDIVFMGTPEFSVPTLEALINDDRFHIPLVITAPDKEQGRSMKLTSSPIKTYALKHGIEVYQPESVNTEESQHKIAACFPEFIVVIAFGQILRDNIISLPKFGTINVHASLLPKFKGASPINAAILAGESESGVTIMQIDQGVDTGGIFAKRATPIEERETAGSLSTKLSTLGAKLLVEVLPQIEKGELQATPQPQDDTPYAKKLKKRHGCIDWHMSKEKIDRKIRGMTPWPGTFSMLPDGRRLKILDAIPSDEQIEQPGKIEVRNQKLYIGCENGSLEILRLQPEGSSKLSATDFINGHQKLIGITLT